MKLRRIFHGLSAVILSLASLSVLIVVPVKADATPSHTWNGDGSISDNFSEAMNWADMTTPGDGDAVTFSDIQGVNDYVLDVDFTAASVDFQCAVVGAPMNITGTHTLTLNGDVTVDSDCGLVTIAVPVVLGSAVQFDGNVEITGGFTGSGDLTVAGALNYAGSALRSSYTGDITIASGGALGVSSQDLTPAVTGKSTTIQSGGGLLIGFDAGSKNATIAEPLSVAGTGVAAFGDDYAALNLIANGGASDRYTETLSSLTLSADANIFLQNYVDATVTNYTKASHALSLFAGSIGTVTLPSPETKLDSSIVTITDTQASTDVTIANGFTYLINGVRRNIIVNSGGTLKGTGTVGTVTVNTGGTVAPGASPGVLNTGDLTFAGGTLQEEIGGTAANAFDQVNVTGAVDLGNSVTTLTVTHWNGFTPALGNSFVIINNDGADPVAQGHTFIGLAEGATLTVGGYTYRISYVGGTGNDVVLTVTGIPGSPTPTPTATPAAPNTGFTTLKSNPALSLIGGLMVATGLSLLAKKQLQKTAKRK